MTANMTKIARRLVGDHAAIIGATAHFGKPALELSSQLALIDFLDCGILELAAVPSRYFDKILDKAETARTNASADAVLLTGAPFAGMAETLADHASIPLFDGLSADTSQLLPVAKFRRLFRMWSSYLVLISFLAWVREIRVSLRHPSRNRRAMIVNSTRRALRCRSAGRRAYLR